MNVANRILEGRAPRGRSAAERRSNGSAEVYRMLEPRFARLRRRGAAPSNTTRMVLLELAAYSERCEPHSAYSLNDLLSPLPMRRCDSRDKLLTWQLFDA